jgi:Predicted membrane protein
MNEDLALHYKYRILNISIFRHFLRYLYGKAGKFSGNIVARPLCSLKMSTFRQRKQVGKRPRQKENGEEMQNTTTEQVVIARKPSRPGRLDRHIYPTIAGSVIALLALLMPMELLGMDHMFTAHMIQHLLLSLIVPPLLLLGIVPEQLRHLFAQQKGVARIIGYATNPFVASLLFNATIWLWHAPPLMQAMMGNTGIHIFSDLTYLLTGLLFWWPLVDPLRDKQHTLPLGGKLAYLFFSDMPMMLIGAGMTFMAPLYAFDMTNPTMHMVITAQDQQLGGLLMWVAGSIFFIIIASVIFLRWMLLQEKEQIQQEIEQEQEEESQGFRVEE